MLTPNGVSICVLGSEQSSKEFGTRSSPWQAGNRRKSHGCARLSRRKRGGAEPAEKGYDQKVSPAACGDRVGCPKARFWRRVGSVACHRIAL